MASALLVLLLAVLTGAGDVAAERELLARASREKTRSWFPRGVNTSAHQFGPANMELLSWAPRSYLYRGFMSSEECDHFIKLAKPQMTKSTVVDASTGKSVDSLVRTSSGTFLDRGQDRVVKAVEQRIAVSTMIPEENGEGFQILRYEHGQHYSEHLDWFHDQFNAKPETGGNRVATLLMYLSDVLEGGETVFPSSPKPEHQRGQEWSSCAQRGLSVKPRKGDALLFFSLDPKGELDPTSLHAGCPVISGVKWSATKWMHVGCFQCAMAVRKRDVCTDYNENCGSWALNGECEKNPGFMVGKDGAIGDCRMACKAC